METRSGRWSIVAWLSCCVAGCLPPLDRELGLDNEFVGYCDCQVCPTWDGQSCPFNAWMPDGTNQILSAPVCRSEAPSDFETNPTLMNDLLTVLRDKCHTYDQNYQPCVGANCPPMHPHRECNPILVSDPRIPQPRPTPLANSGDLAATLKLHSCQGQRFPLGVFSPTSPWSTRYQVDRTTSFMDLHLNGHDSRVMLDGSFTIEGLGCYDGVGVTRCPQVIKFVGLSGMNDALLGGDYDLRDIAVVSTASIYGKVDNVPPNQAFGTTEPGDIQLAIDWGLAAPGAVNGTLYFAASQINAGMQRWGSEAAWAGGVQLGVDYRHRAYSFYAPLQLPAGGTGTMYLHGTTNNFPPVALAGPDQVVTANPRTHKATVTLHGQFIDPDADNVYYAVRWYKAGTTWTQLGANNLNPIITLPEGNHTIILYVWDQDYATGIDTVNIRVNRGS